MPEGGRRGLEPFGEVGTFQFQGPVALRFGWGRLQDVGGLSCVRGARRALIVTDEGVRAAGLADRLGARLEEAGLQWDVFAGVDPGPSLAACRGAAEAARGLEADVIVGLGGGSSLDAAKVASVLAVHGGSGADGLGADGVPGPGLPAVLCPTTAGSGAEVTGVAFFKDPALGGARRAVASRYLLAEAAVVDPEFTLHLPAQLTARAGLGALTRAVEAYVSPRGNPITDGLAEAAVSRIARFLGPAVHQGARRPRARAEMALAATMAGLCGHNGGGGAAQALADALEAVCGLPYGLAHGAVLSAVMEYNIPAAVERYARLAVCLGVPRDPAASQREIAYRGAQAVRQLCIDCGVEPRLAAHGVGRDVFDEVIAVAQRAHPRLLEENPRGVGPESLRDVLEMAL